MTNAEIQVGEYVRTIDGKIYKTDGDKLFMNDAKTILFKEITKIPYDSIPYIVKTHSFNLIDLIEVGDYVNGERVIEKDETMLGHYKYVVVTLDRQLFEENISTIVTKEQFANMEYKVYGGEERE